MSMSKKMIKVIAFTVSFLYILNFTQSILQGKWYGDSFTYARIKTLYKEEPAPDAVFIGSSHACWHINPLVIFEEYGISSCDFGATGQSAEVTKLYVQEAIKLYSPKVIIVEVNNFAQLMASESRSRQWLDPIKFSKAKMETVNDILNNNKTYNLDVKYDSFVSYIVPLLRFHDRWKQLSENDFTLNKDEPAYNKIMHFHGYDPHYWGGKTNFDHYNDPYIFKDNELKEIKSCFEDIVGICRKSNVELLLLKTASPSWRQDKHDLIASFAVEYNIPFLDCNELMDEIGLDLNVDFQGGGEKTDNSGHLSDAGATKHSIYLGQYLKNNYNLLDHRNDRAYEDWNYDWQVYQQDKAAYFLSIQTDILEYMEMMQNKNYTVFFAAKGDLGVNDYPGLTDKIENLGLSPELDNIGRSGYIAVLDAKTKIIERLGDNKLVWSCDLRGHSIMIASESANLGNFASVKVDGLERCHNRQGLNIVVYDNVLEKIVDSVTFDLLDSGKCYR